MTGDICASRLEKLHYSYCNIKCIIVIQETEIDDPLASLKAMTAEDICGLREGMTYDELDTLLKMLYRRHNRAASSLDDTKRAEADIVLDAIVEIRQRYLEERER